MEFLAKYSKLIGIRGVALELAVSFLFERLLDVVSCDLLEEFDLVTKFEDKSSEFSIREDEDIFVPNVAVLGRGADLDCEDGGSMKTAFTGGLKLNNLNTWILLYKYIEFNP